MFKFIEGGRFMSKQRFFDGTDEESKVGGANTDSAQPDIIQNMNDNIEDMKDVLDNRYYVTIEFLRGNRIYDYEDYLLGPVLRKSGSEIFKKYVNNMYDKNIKGYMKAKRYNSNTDSFDRMIETLEKYK